MFQVKEKLYKHLKEKCLSEHFEQLSIKSLAKLFEIPNLSSKVL